MMNRKRAPQCATWCGRRLIGVGLVWSLMFALAAPFGRVAEAAPLSAACSGGTWNAQFTNQSPGYIKLNPGTQQQAWIQYRDTGTCFWDQASAFIGTWNPEPGQDLPSSVGGAAGCAVVTNWWSCNRVAMTQTTVASGALADYYFNLKGPTTPGRYRLHIRPLIEGIQWMEDYGAYFEVQNQMTNSRYMSTVDTVMSYNLGCKLGTMDRYAPGTQDNLVFLDYGAPFYSGGYGTKYPGTQTFVSITEITAAVQEFARGYYFCTDTDTVSTLRIAIGTSNDDIYTNYSHGQAWAGMVNNIATYLATNGYSTQVNVAGASDIEMGFFATPTQVYDWLNGYDSVNNYYMYNYGDAAGCPETGQTATSRACNNGWTQENIFWVSYGASPSQVIPEIYNRGGANARQWQQIKLYAKLAHNNGFLISGVLTQYEACLTSPDCGPVPNCNPLGLCTNNTPQDGYTQLMNALNSDPLTVQGAPQWVTDVTWNNNPAANP